MSIAAIAPRSSVDTVPNHHHDRWVVEFRPKFGGWIIMAYGPGEHGDLIAQFETESDARLAAHAVNHTVFARRASWEVRP